MPVKERKECSNGQRCHIAGKGITKFGTKFTQKAVADIASSSVQLVQMDEGTAKRVASGTLISSNIVLCAAHSFQNLTRAEIASKIEVILFYELAASAPPGEQWEYNKTPSEWTKGATIASSPQAKVVKVLEMGDSFGLDFAMLAIEWKNPESKFSTNVVKLPRLPIIPKPSSTLSSELLLVGHPWQQAFMGEPTQATSGKLTLAYGPHPEQLEGSTYTYAGFGATVGFSGGGVFNDKGEIVGVLKGSRLKPDAKSGAAGPCFLNLKRAAETTAKDAITTHNFDRLRNWLKGEPWIKDGDIAQKITLMK